MKRPQVGDWVRYVRVLPDNTEQTGHGHLISEYLSADGYRQYRIQDGVDTNGKPNVFAIDHVAINATPEAERKYFDGILKIREISEATTEKQKKIVEEGNKQIRDLTVKLLGNSITLEVPADALSA